MLIGITGPSGSHKTQVAKRLQRAHGFDRIHAGRPVKRAMRAGFGLTKEQTSGDLRDTPTMRLGGAAFRDGSEAVGDAVHRAMPNATSVEMERRVHKRMMAGKSVVVDGIRSPVEADTIRRMGGYVVRAEGDAPADQSKPMDVRQALVDKVDYRIDTTGSKKDRQARADSMVMDLGRCQMAALNKPMVLR